MGGGKGAAKQASREADQARADEQARQARVRQGTDRINSIFNGSLQGAGQVGAGSAFDPNATYYTADGQVWKPQAQTTTGTTAGGVPTAKPGTPFNFGDAMARIAYDNNDTSARRLAPASAGRVTSGPSAADQFAQASAGGKLFSGTQMSGGFNDDFFNRQRQNYIDYATPQLDQQYGDANKQLTFSLTRSGLFDSSVRGEKASDLQRAYDLNKQKIADDALSHSTQSRNAVEDARANLISMLNATGDAEGAANAALARSQALSQAPSFSPLTSLFADFTNGLGVQAAAERSYAAGGMKPTISTGLFAPRNSVTYG
ncbi:hypothetical protein IGS74_18060 [Aureimonas sp. OT7]|uniref:hypothetical protein n=1 Tax=Aureimonas sp. OT7 TaxID=2816454 RepID=UPI001784C614|nr:hypothetical protein [Aureimonas sp. OT7]QOG06407.1 hypothetical protein IGS74_18060 [Aureimonas sp. OT7]